MSSSTTVAKRGRYYYFLNLSLVTTVAKNVCTTNTNSIAGINITNDAGTTITTTTTTSNTNTISTTNTSTTTATPLLRLYFMIVLWISYSKITNT